MCRILTEGSTATGGNVCQCQSHGDNGKVMGWGRGNDGKMQLSHWLIKHRRHIQCCVFQNDVGLK